MADGLTLIETLVAISVLVMIVAILSSALNTLNRVAAGQQRRSAEMDAIMAMQTISEQLASTVPISVSNKPVFMITSETDHPEQGDKIRFAVFTEPPFEYGNSNRRAVSKEYRFEAGEGSEGDLVCRSRPLRGPGSIATGEFERVAGRIEGFSVRAFKAGKWSRTWGGEGDDELPEAVELTLVYNAGSEIKSNSVAVYIPAGNTITSSFERASSSTR
jgi:type II secretory pathway component PulJ